MNVNLKPYHQVARIQELIKNRSDKPALAEWDNFQKQEMTWQQVGEKVEKIAQSLLKVGVAVQDRVAIFANNSLAWALTDLAILHCRAVTVPIYATNTAHQSAYIINNAEAELLFVGAQAQMDAALEMQSLCPQLRYIIALDNSIDLKGCNIACYFDQFIELGHGAMGGLLAQRIAERDLDDLFTIIYTSGTTGEPKGVMLTYLNMAYQLYFHDNRLSVTDDDISLSFLPLSHVFERAWSFYIMHAGAVNVYLRDTHMVRQALTDVRPTAMCAVPRLYEKVFTAINDRVAKAVWYKRALFNSAIWIGKKKFWAEREGRKLNPLMRGMHKLAYKLVLGKLSNILGGRIKMLPAAGAKLDDNIILFFRAINVSIKCGYGMTESCATVSCWADDEFKFGSIGTPLEGIDVKIGADNEILVRGPTIMKGYYKRPEETAATFTEDGFLKTGDAGYLDDEGNLFITERIKDLMKTSTGKYIAPQALEGALSQDRFIEQVAVIADARKYVSALIVPCFDALEEYAKSINLSYQNRMELLKNSHIVEMIEKRLNEMQKEFSRFEQIKKFTLLPKEFSMELGELTPTLKLRRKIILQRYQNEINSMYTEN